MPEASVSMLAADVEEDVEDGLCTLADLALRTQHMAPSNEDEELTRKAAERLRTSWSCPVDLEMLELCHSGVLSQDTLDVSLTAAAEARAADTVPTTFRSNQLIPEAVPTNLKQMVIIPLKDTLLHHRMARRRRLSRAAPSRIPISRAAIAVR